MFMLMKKTNVKVAQRIVNVEVKEEKSDINNIQGDGGSLARVGGNWLHRTHPPSRHLVHW